MISLPHVGGELSALVFLLAELKLSMGGSCWALARDRGDYCYLYLVDRVWVRFRFRFRFRGLRLGFTVRVRGRIWVRIKCNYVNRGAHTCYSLTQGYG